MAIEFFPIRVYLMVRIEILYDPPLGSAIKVSESGLALS